MFSFFTKVLLDDEIDDFLRSNRQKSIAKKRTLKNKILHFDIKETIPKRYILFNFIILATVVGMSILTLMSFFVSSELNRLFESIGIAIILTNGMFIAINRTLELLLDQHTKRWHKGLLIGVVLVVFVLLLILN